MNRWDCVSPPLSPKQGVEMYADRWRAHTKRRATRAWSSGDETGRRGSHEVEKRWVVCCKVSTQLRGRQ